MMGATLAMSICSTCAIPSSCLWGCVSRVHVVVGGEGFGVLLVAVAVFAPVCLQKSKEQRFAPVYLHTCYRWFWGLVICMCARALSCMVATFLQAF